MIEEGSVVEEEAPNKSIRTKMSTYKQSSLCAVGEMYAQFGALLMNPNTTLVEIVDFAVTHSFNVSFALAALTPPSEGDKRG